MPKSEIETLIDKATNENNVVEDWGLIMEICDQINHMNSKKEIIKIFIKKLNDKDPHVIEHSLTLLNACISNCDRNFKLEVSSRIFVEEIRSFILKKRFEKLSRTMANMLEKWTKEAEFKNDPALSLIQTLYTELKKQGADFNLDVTQVTTNKAMKQELLDKREEEELAKAIQLSLKESQAKTPSSSSSKTNGSSSSSSMFGQLMQNTQSISESYGSKTGPTTTTTTPSASGGNQRRRVKALYDFEAAEDNEITFKAGDVLFLSDDNDPNWWKGFDMSGFEGLFPSNFVTFDLNEKIEVYDAKTNSMKKVSFNDNVDVNLIQNVDAQEKKKIVIDEKKIDDCIELLQNADPTGEIQPDSHDLLELEEECYMMGPLIDKKLQEIDEQHATLEDLNLKILEAFQLYNNLMKESISKQTALLNSSQMAPPQTSQQPSMINPAMGTNGAAINYAAAPPQLEANSLAFANKLNSLAYGPQATAASNGYGINPNGSGYNLPNAYPNMYAMAAPNGVDLSSGASMMPPSQYPMPTQPQQQQPQQPPQQYFTS